jgi:hypothetical protein
MVNTRSRRSTQGIVPPQTATPTTRKKKVMPSSEKPLRHGAESRRVNQGGGNAQQIQTPKSAAYDPRFHLPRHMRFATPVPFTPTSLDALQRDPSEGHRSEIPEEGLKASLSQEDYATWEKMIAELKGRGTRLPAFRIQRRAAVRELLGHHSTAISLHNRYARTHNQGFEDKHERFHLPVFEELGIDKVQVSNKEDIEQLQESSNKLTVRDPIQEDVLDMQFDGAMDIEMEGKLQLADDYEVPTLPTDKEQPSSDHNEENDADGANIEMQDAVVSLGCAGPSQEVGGEAPGAAGNSGSVVPEPQPAEENAKLTQVESVPAPAEAGVIIEMPKERDGADTSDRDAQDPHNLPMMSAEHPRAASADPGAAADPTAHTEPAADVEPTAATDLTPPVARDQSVQSYLAWLHQRQTRFPIAKPNYSECVALGKRLGRPALHVCDEIMYRWGLETDSRSGDWYKQNRLQVLGEDPRFDEERIGK